MLTQVQAAGVKRREYLKAVMDQALALFNQGQFDSAEILFATVAEEPAVKPLVQHMRGVIAMHLGQNERAQELIEEAIQLNPSDAEAHANLGLILLKEYQHAPALAAYAAALTLQPANVSALFGLAKAMAGLGLTDLAFDAFGDVLARAPDYIDAVIDFGSLLNDLGRHTEAVELLRDAFTRHPGQGELDSALTVSMFPIRDSADDVGEQAKAISAFRDALTRHPDRAELHTMLSFCLFAVGDWPAAWAEYEWRLKDPQVNKKLLRTDRKCWDGEELVGKTILLQSEQGYGDTLQFVRYAPMVKTRGGRVVLRAPEPLVPLLRSVAGLDAVFGAKEKEPAFDVHVPLLSLPLIFGTQIDTVPAPIPYLRADPDLVRRWRKRVGTHAGLTIGLFWQGNPAHPNDRHRSMRLDAMRPLLDCPGARFVSLQVGPGQEQLKGLEDRIADLGCEMDVDSFADAAAIVANLDLVISVDSAVVHLAGALGKPAWILLAVCNDWRWLKGRPETMWYPQARLFRQRKAGDWEEVIERARAELWSLVGAGAPPPPDTIARAALRLAALPPRAVDPVVCDALFVEGVRHHRAKDLDRSKKMFEQVLVLDPQHVNTLCNLGALELGLGNRVRALALLERAVALAPTLAPARVALADVLLVSGRTDDAVAQYCKALDLAPNNEAAHAAYAAALRQLGDLKRATVHFGEAERITREHYRKALAATPNSDRVHAEFAMALRNLGDLDGAMKHFQAAVSINQGQSPEFYEALGRTCAVRGNAEGAEISLKHALALNPRLVSAHCALGELYLGLGRNIDAGESFQRALEIDGACAAALRAIGHAENGLLDAPSPQNAYAQ
jgi:tetratricopeptide (TPR) repeat protein